MSFFIVQQRQYKDRVKFWLEIRIFTNSSFPKKAQRKMATLASVKGHLTILGIVPISEEMLPSLLHPLLSVINFVYPLCWFLSVLTYNITVVCFVLFEAETFIEFAECGFYCSVSFLHVVSYAILFQTRLELFALFKDADEMVQKSKFELY